MLANISHLFVYLCLFGFFFHSFVINVKTKFAYKIRGKQGKLILAKILKSSGLV